MQFNGPTKGFWKSQRHFVRRFQLFQTVLGPSKEVFVLINLQSVMRCFRENVRNEDFTPRILYWLSENLLVAIFKVI